MNPLALHKRVNMRREYLFPLNGKQGLPSPRVNYQDALSAIGHTLFLLFTVGSFQRMILIESHMA